MALHVLIFIDYYNRDICISNLKWDSYVLRSLYANLQHLNMPSCPSLETKKAKLKKLF